jgi:uncharacterized protein (TIGR02246 family)
MPMLILLAAATAASIAQQGDMAIVQNLETALADRANAGDASGIAALYAPDATLLPAKMTAITGRGAIEGFWQQAAAGVTAVQIRTVTTTRLSPDMIQELGTYSMTPKAGGAAMTGNYLVLWRHTDKGWLIAADTWS